METTLSTYLPKGAFTNYVYKRRGVSGQKNRLFVNFYTIENVNGGGLVVKKRQILANLSFLSGFMLNSMYLTEWGNLLSDCWQICFKIVHMFYFQVWFLAWWFSFHWRAFRWVSTVYAWCCNPVKWKLRSMTLLNNPNHQICWYILFNG